LDTEPGWIRREEVQELVLEFGPKFGSVGILPAEERPAGKQRQCREVL
jgi:hypothetical protein